MMKFENITFYVVIGMAIINIAGALSKIAKIKKEEPLYKIYEEILLQRILLWILIIPIILNKINVFLWKQWKYSWIAYH